MGRNPHAGKANKSVINTTVEIKQEVKAESLKAPEVVIEKPQPIEKKNRKRNSNNTWR